jgi:hypothetical protein
VNSLKRGAGRSRHKGEHNLVARVSEEGVTFRSYRWLAVVMVLVWWWMGGCVCADGWVVCVGGVGVGGGGG